jgi:hypothetical protein
MEIPKAMKMDAVRGVQLPDMESPLGFNARQSPPLSFLCMLAGAYIAFPRVLADADAAYDARRPLLEKYKTRNEYVNCGVRTAARELQWDRLQLSDHAAIIIQSAAENSRWNTPAPCPQT